MIFISISKNASVFLKDVVTLGETRDLGVEHVDSIDVMLKSTFCQLSIDCSLTVHL